MKRNYKILWVIVIYFKKNIEMKRLLFIFTFGFVFLNFLWFTNAEYQVSEKIKIRMDGMMSMVAHQRWDENITWQLDRYQKIINSFSNIKLQWEQKEMIWYLLYLFNNKVNQLKQMPSSQNETIKNVDRSKVQDEILKWHNDERKSIWLSEYKINDKLNYTANIWAENLARLNKKSSTHTRNSGDWYYNYDKILSRFNNLWVTFDNKLTVFSESVAYQYYSCNKDDCTQEMISALKKWFNFWMSEKWRSYRPHYNAISSNIFTDMWFGVWVSGKWYRVVVHYGVNVN